jgi:hypothetical protein
LDFDSRVKQADVSTAEPRESSVLASRVRSRVNFAPSSEANKVLVVPNPYRVDVNYTFESGGYEGRARRWTENQRLLKFIHLPEGHSTVRIYSLSGDVVATFSHDSETEGGELDWNMLNESNRAITSGVYVFTVESQFGTQTGKFVVIR